MFHSLCHMVDQDGNPKNKVCPECDTAFKVPIGLKHHLLLHTGELPFLCLHCWRSFSSHIDLKLHIRREHLFHLDMPTPNKTPSTSKVKKLKGENLKEEIKSGEYIAVQAENDTMETQHAINSEGQQVQFVMATEGDEDGQEGTQTIVLGSDAAASLVDSNGQDMIVVIQSDDFDQSQGLMIVDPSQLQHMVTTHGGQAQITGTTTTTMSNGEGEEMIVSDAHHGQNEYISLQMPDGTSQRGTLVLAHDGSDNQGQEGYIVVTQEDAKGTFALQTTEAPEALEQKVTIVQKSQEKDEVSHHEDHEQSSV